MADLASFWVGSDLGAIELASIRSFLRHGDSFTVYAPHPISNLPDGAIWRDANEIMPSTTILRHRKTQSAALHADLFRYALLTKTDSIWVDLDVIALRSFDGAGDWLFGFEAPGAVNNAVLRLPRHSTTLHAMTALTPQSRGVPAYLSGGRRFRYHAKNVVHSLWGDGLTIDRWPWGATGPRLLTYHLRQSGEMCHARPVSAFYSVPLGEASRFVDPAALTASDLPGDAWAVHLWASNLRKYLNHAHGGQIPTGSFLDAAVQGAL